MRTRTCNRCRESLPLKDFNRSRSSTAGRMYVCRACDRKRARDWYRRNREYRLEYDRGRSSTATRLEHYRRQHERRGKQDRAVSALNVAVRSGRVRKPKACQGCLRRRKVYGHHVNYSKPLSVIWLCRECHVLTHNRMREAANA